MATVPSSGILSMLALAQEALYGTYGSGTITGPISTYDLMNGGTTGGSGNTYPTLNTSCAPNPSDCAGTATYASTTGLNTSGGSITIYYRSDIYSSASNFVNSLNAVAYSNNTGTARYAAGNGYEFNYPGCTNEVNLNSSGQITYTQPIC